MNAPFPQTHQPEHEAADTLLGTLPARRAVKKAVILAAGRGRRMGKLTADRHAAGGGEKGGPGLVEGVPAFRASGGVLDDLDALGDGDQRHPHHPRHIGSTSTRRLAQSILRPWAWAHSPNRCSPAPITAGRSSSAARMAMCELAPP